MNFPEELLKPKFSYFVIIIIAISTQLFVNGEFLFAIGSIILGVILEYLLLLRLGMKYNDGSGKN
jgi:hypothetical protein